MEQSHIVNLDEKRDFEVNSSNLKHVRSFCREVFEKLNINQALLSGTINTGVKHKTGKGVSEHMVQSLNEPIDCSMTSSNELAEMFFDDYNNLDCYLEKN